MEQDEVRRLLAEAGAIVVDPPPLPPATDTRLVAAIRARHARELAYAAYPVEWDRLLPGVPHPGGLRARWRPLTFQREYYELELTGWSPTPDPHATLRAARDLVVGAVDERSWTDSGGLWLRTTGGAHALEVYGVAEPPTVTLTLRTVALAIPDDLARELLAAGTESVGFGSVGVGSVGVGSVGVEDEPEGESDQQ
jgi:hypothetical protein